MGCDWLPLVASRQEWFWRVPSSFGPPGPRCGRPCDMQRQVPAVFSGCDCGGLRLSSSTASLVANRDRNSTVAVLGQGCSWCWRLQYTDKVVDVPGVAGESTETVEEFHTFPTCRFALFTLGFWRYFDEFLYLAPNFRTDSVHGFWKMFTHFHVKVDSDPHRRCAVFTWPVLDMPVVVQRHMHSPRVSRSSEIPQLQVH